MIKNSFLYKFIFLVYLFFISWGNFTQTAAAAAAAGEDAAHRISRVAAIRIIPYEGDPLENLDPALGHDAAAADAGAAAVEEPPIPDTHICCEEEGVATHDIYVGAHHDRYRRTDDTLNEFGLGVTYRYLVPAASQFTWHEEDGGYFTGSPGTHGYYLGQLRKWTEENKGCLENKNTLLVRMVVEEEEDTLVESFFGIFISGSKYKVKSGNVGDLFGGRCTPGRIQIKNLWERGLISPFLTLSEDLDLSHLYGTNMKKLMGETFYKIRPFILNEKRFRPVSFGDAKKVNFRERIENLLFDELIMTDEEKLPEKVTTVETLTKYNEVEASRDMITFKLFGKVRDHKDEDSVFKGQKAQDNFTDSEQIFLDCIENFDASPDWKENILLEHLTSEVNIKKVNLYFYSRRDMCFHCRGTLSRILTTGKLKEILKKLLGRSEIPEIKVSAFSWETTDKEP